MPRETKEFTIALIVIYYIDNDSLPLRLLRMLQRDSISYISETNPSFDGPENLWVYPNPFRHKIAIKFANLDFNTKISLRIYDIMDITVKQFKPVDGYSAEIFWEGCDDAGSKLPVGVYFI